MLIQEQFEFVKDVAKLIQKAEELGYILTFGEAWRPETQAWINSLPAKSALLAIAPGSDSTIDYRDKVGGVGILKSIHRDRLAIDFNIFKESRLCNRDECVPLGDFWQSLNSKNRWGGYFTTRIDAPHFERFLS